MLCDTTFQWSRNEKFIRTLFYFPLYVCVLISISIVYLYKPCCTWERPRALRTTPLAIWILSLSCNDSIAIVVVFIASKRTPQYFLLFPLCIIINGGRQRILNTIIFTMNKNINWFLRALIRL